MTEFGKFNKFYTVDFTLLAIAKCWIECSTLADVIKEIVKAYKDEYCDLSNWNDESVAKVIVERWCYYNKQLDLFDLQKFIEYMSPEGLWKIKFSSQQLGYHCNCLCAIMGILTLVESKKLPGFSEWLIENGHKQ